MTHLRVSLALAVIAAFTLAGSARAQTADATIEKYLTAIGGREALGKLTSRKSTGTVTLATPAGNVSGPIEQLSKTPNKSRVYMSLDLTALGAGTMAIEQKFDGTAGYTLNSLQGDTEITGNMLDNLRNNMFPTPLLFYKESGVKMELQPDETLNGKKLHVVVLTPKAGSSSRLYFDPDTSLLVRSVAKVTSPQAGDLTQTNELSDYRDVDGVKVPFKITNSNEVQSFTITLTKVEHNVAIDDAMFVKK